MAVLLLVAACTATDSTTVPPTVAPTTPPPISSTTLDQVEPTTTATTSTTVPAPRDCTIDHEPGEPVFESLDESDLVGASLQLSRQYFSCADEVVIAPADDLAVVAVAAQLADATDSTLLLHDPDSSAIVNAALTRLGPERITLVELDGDWLADHSAEIVEIRGLLTDLGDVARRAAGSIGRVGMAGTGPDTIAAVLRSILDGRTTTVPTRQSGVCDPDSRIATEAIEDAADGRTAHGEVWLVDVCSPGLALLAAASIGSEGTVLLIDGRDLRHGRQLVTAVHASPSGINQIHIAGEVSEEADWQLATLLAGDELPGGGLLLFPGRRIVALYGNPSTRFLGVLGEQGVEAAIERAREVAEPYGADGLEVLPGFEIIASVASVSAGRDGDYSNEMSVDQLRPWVEAAGNGGVYVVLDLQSGRSDFLAQAKNYEELLLLPHVGLALDPEWRLKPNQVHLEQIGSVGAEEVNRVVEWLAGLVRENRLPQKLFIVHQFRLDMVTNRSLINKPPELAMMVHADGQGPIATKYTTYSTLTGRPDADQWWWGWKNFYDEDSPTPSPEQVLELDPLPVYVSYQ
jgi:hypothetical protein